MPRKASQSVPSLLKRLEKIFNRYIRLRDTGPDGASICISCGEKWGFEKIQAGHLFTSKSSLTRFDERNVHGQCQRCNGFTADAAKPYYSAQVIRKLGLETFFELEALSRKTHKWTSDWLKKKIEEYEKKNEDYK